MRILSTLVCCLCLLFLTTLDVRADQRVALVIGNGAYRSVPTLPNPTNDAADVAAALKRSGFDVILETNLDQAGMQEAAIRFARGARDADVALFYYSGHALQYAGVNYLVPVDAVLHDEMDLRRMVRADEILSDLQQAKNLRIMVLDACRDNPFAEELKRSIGKTRGINVGRGLAKMESPEGTIISYATQAGRTADDGDGRNSPYTTAFLKHIEDKDNITTVFQTISANVYQGTKGTQVPELSLSFFGELYLNGKPQKPAGSATAALPVAPCAEAADHWHSAEAAGTIEAYRDHLLRFPNCAFASLAKSKIEELSKAADAAKRADAFDGTWIARETCENKPPFPAANLQYALRIKDGTLHTSFGDEGKPGFTTFDGKIGTDGAATIAVDGLTKPARDPLHRPAGTPFHYTLALQFKDAGGRGVRTQTPRPCRMELSRLSADPAADDGSREKANAKPNAAAAIEPDRRETGARSAPPAAGNGGISCSVMRERCGAMCLQLTGRPNCAAIACVRLHQECMSSGCWHGRGFSGCGLARR